MRLGMGVPVKIARRRPVGDKQRMCAGTDTGHER